MSAGLWVGDVSSVGLGVYFVNLVRPLGVCERGRSGHAEHIRMSQYRVCYVTHKVGGNTHIEEFYVMEQ